MNNIYRNLHSFFALLIVGVFLSGCASTPPTSSIDPYESMNRSIFSFNESVDEHALKPVAKGYKFIVPDPVETMISNFYSNLDDLNVIFNDLLQLKFKNAGNDTARFVINTTLGMAGLVDFGTPYGFPKRHEDFGQTLAHYGVSSGPYLVLPVLGGSTMRDAGAMIVDMGTNPNFYSGIVFFGIGPAVGALQAVSKRSELLDAEEIVDEGALDKYEFLRDAHLQRRRSLIYDGNPPRSIDDELEGEGEDSVAATTEGVDQDPSTATTKKKRSVVVEYIDPEDSENEDASDE